MDIMAYIQKNREIVDAFLASHFEAPFAPQRLNASMTYSLFAGGKRIRPVLAIASYEACGGTGEDIIPYAASLEFIHTYSLIHDDLPSMDNDDLRRGKPTNHKIFGEGMAILAGDALLTEAFYILSSAKGGRRISPRAIIRLIREVAMAAGAHGMVGGQAEDLLSENAAPDGENLAFIHTHKTGALITAAVRMGAILANATRKDLRALTRYGENIGLAFQIIDDILDVQGESSELGKQTGSDERKKKMTYPGLYGIERSMKKAEELVDASIAALASFSEKAAPLREVARYLLSRKS